MKCHGRQHKETITAAEALDIWRLMGCQPRGHEVVAKDNFKVDEFLEVTNKIVDRARRRDSEYYERVFRMIDFHSRKRFNVEDLKLFTRMCGKQYSPEVLESLVHTIDSSGNDEFVTKQDYIDWFEGLLAEEAGQSQSQPPSARSAASSAAETAGR